MTTAGPMCATSLSLRVRDAGGGGVPAGCVEAPGVPDCPLGGFTASSRFHMFVPPGIARRLAAPAPAFRCRERSGG